MKAYTDLLQSKKLAKILPLDSADMGYIPSAEDDDGNTLYTAEFKSEIIFDEVCIPCWSLAALLNVLPYPSLHKTFSGWRCDSYNKEGKSCILGESSDNLIDACYTTIVELKERNLI